MQNKKGLKIISYAITFLAISSIIAAIIIKNNMDKKVAETNQEERRCVTARIERVYQVFPVTLSARASELISTL